MRRLFLALVPLVLTACGGQSAPPPREAPRGVDTGEAPPPPAEGGSGAATAAGGTPARITTDASAAVPEERGEPSRPVELSVESSHPSPPMPAPTIGRKDERRSKSAVAGGAAAAESDRAPEPASPKRSRRDADRAEREAAAAPVAYAPVAAPAMKAGRHDDNKEYNRFLAFLAENQQQVVYPVDVSERLVLRTTDRDGKSLANCAVQVSGLDGKRLAEASTYADGRTQFFPAAQGRPADADYKVSARCGGETKNGQLARRGRREIELRFGFARTVPKHVPVDVAIVIDTTGSMQSQIDRLKKTLQAIHFQLSELSTKPDVRFGLVAYRDRGDEYVTRVTPFTADVAAFQRALDALAADGGGDTPEDLQTALEQALHALTWRPSAVRVGFAIADAIPHTDYGQVFDYREAMRESLGRGIKWVMVGAGGLGRDGEVIFRQIAQFTMAEYVFVTESAPGDSEGGVGEASHHVGANYKTENLDQAIVRIVRRELSYWTDSPRDFDDTIVAGGSTTASRDDVLAPAVEEALRQLADYSALRLAPGTPVAVVPVTATDARYADVAGYLTERLQLAASRNPSFRVVERDLGAVAQEIKLQLSDLFDVTETVPIGKLLGAEALIVARLSVSGGGAALFTKLIRVETGEVLSVSRVEIGGPVLRGS